MCTLCIHRAVCKYADTAEIKKDELINKLNEINSSLKDTPLAVSMRCHEFKT